METHRRSNHDQKYEQNLLHLDPQFELRFKGNFSNTVSCELSLSNPTDNEILFRIKTTKPNQYLVSPNGGRIQAKQSTVIKIILQSLHFDPSTDRGKHKFLVEHCVAPVGSDGEDLRQYFRSIPIDQIRKSKLQCVFTDLGGSVVPVGAMKTRKKSSVSFETSSTYKSCSSAAENLNKPCSSMSYSCPSDNVGESSCVKDISSEQSTSSGLVTSLVSIKVAINNTNDKALLFRIKASTPTRYVVKPACGHVQAKSRREITIVYQSQNFDSHKQDLHKFMVQFCSTPPNFDADTDVEQYFLRIPADQVHCSKFQSTFCNFRISNNSVSFCKSLDDKPRKEMAEKSLTKPKRSKQHCIVS